MSDENVLEEEWWWIDYMEDEVDDWLKPELERLLQASEEDEHSLQSFQLVRSWVKICGETELQGITEESLQALGDRVMSQIDKASAATSQPAAKRLSSPSGSGSFSRRLQNSKNLRKSIPSL